MSKTLDYIALIVVFIGAQLGTDRIVPAGSGSADLWRYDVDQSDYLKSFPGCRAENDQGRYGAD